MRTECTIGAVCAVGGSVLLFAATCLHPVPVDPNDAVAAFTEYVADRSWVAIHLAQLAGFALMMAALLVLAGQLDDSLIRSLAAAGVTVCLAVATVLQAVDGIALKAMVDVWSASASTERLAAFEGALAVRHVEIGLDSTLSLLLGVTVMIYGIALAAQQTYPRWIGGIALVGAVFMIIAGVVMGYSGYSDRGMGISMVASSILLVWMLALGVVMWRQRRRLSAHRVS